MWRASTSAAIRSTSVSLRPAPLPSPSSLVPPLPPLLPRGRRGAVGVFSVVSCPTHTRPRAPLAASPPRSSPNLLPQRSFFTMAAACCAGAHGGAVGTRKREFAHYPEDFEHLPAMPLHYDLHLDVTEERALVTLNATYVYEGEGPLTKLRLNADSLEIQSFELYGSASDITGARRREKQDFVGHVRSLKDPQPLQFEVDADNRFVYVFPLPEIQPGQQFTLRSRSIARPTANILEGIYYDYTPPEPPGLPRTMITQCQQYGFQRIAPCIDEMAGKAYWTTTILADRRYTNLITNGDRAPGFYDPATGDPVYQLPDPAEEKAILGEDKYVERHLITFHNHNVNMSPYLFFMGCGHYVTYRQWVEYPDGDRFLIELLVFPGLVEPEHAAQSLKSLHDSILWLLVSTGPETTHHHEERAHIYQLLEERQALLKKASLQGRLWWSSEEPAPQADEDKLSEEERTRLAEVRAELKRLIGVWGKTGYKYTFQVYREIAMENSDYGGMENLNNTTILSSRLVPGPFTTDPAYVYMEGVKIHEKYHCINGSQVTGQSPFQIWLNEAVTVHIQREREDVLFGKDFMRLGTVQYAFRPATGPLARDASPNSMAIEPEGFNRTQELISAMTYSKAPEFVRMVQLTIGDDAFYRGLDHYHTTFAFGNATTRDWIRSMEEVSGVELQRMADLWLKRTGHPVVSFTTAYDPATATFTAQIEQACPPAKADDPLSGPWDFPITWSLIGAQGQVLRQGLLRMQAEQHTLAIPEVAEAPAYLSFATGWSFFGRWKDLSATPASLRAQALTDPDVVNRNFAFRALLDQVKADCIKSLVAGANGGAAPAPSAALVDLYVALLFDQGMEKSARASILSDDESIPSFPELQHHYDHLHTAKVALFQAVWDAAGPRIMALYDELEAANRPGPHLEGIADRSLKHLLLSLAFHGVCVPSAVAGRQQAGPGSNPAGVAERALKLATHSTFMSDRCFGLRLYLQVPQLEVATKEAVRQQIRAEWSQNPIAFEEYIRVISGIDSDREWQPYIEELADSEPLFNINLAGHSRTLARNIVLYRRRALLTAAGRELLARLFVRLGKVNQMAVYDILAAFDDVAAFEPATQAKVLETLRDMRQQMDPKKEQSLFNQLGRILKPFEQAAEAEAKA